MEVGRDNSDDIATRYGIDGPGWNPAGGGGVEIFGTRPDRPWSLLSLLHNGYRVFPRSKASGAHPASYTMGTESFPGVKRPGPTQPPTQWVPSLSQG